MSATLQSDPYGRMENPVAVRIASMVALLPSERQILRDLSLGARHHAPQTLLCSEGQVQPPQALLAGWACYQRLLRDGRRQIIRFLLPGDVIGSLIHPNRPPSSAALSLTPVVLGDARPLQRAHADPALAMPGLADAVNQMDYADEVSLGDQVMRLGRQTAYERVVHLILEFHNRLSAVGQVKDNSFTLPLTQEVLADALGLSVVHINRTLQQVRRDRLFDMRSGQVTLRQPELMQAMADWTPATS